MTGETERNPSGWTSDTLKVLEDEKIMALQQYFASEIRRVEAMLAGQERAVALLGGANQIAQDKFEATVRDGFVKQNEFRGSLDDLGKLMATRRELESLQEEYRRGHADLINVVGDLRSRLDIGPSQIPDLLSQRYRQQGREEKVQITNANIFALIGVIAVVAGAIGHFLH